MHRTKQRLKAIEPSLLAHLDFDLIAPFLEESKVLTSDEAAHVLRRARSLSKEHAVHEFVRILAKSPFRSLRCALEQCASCPGHKELIKELDHLVASDLESDTHESESKVEEQQQDSDMAQLSSHNLHVSWKQLSSMPVGMQNAQARVLGNKIYIGGGTTGMIDLSRKVYVYDYVYDKWEVLPASPVYNFALEVYENNILLIGGRDTDSGEVTGDVFCWDQADKKWKDALLCPMPTARHSASCTTYGQYVVVAGGFAVTFPISTVEVYSGTRQQWLSAQSLPQAQSHMKQVVANGTWILLGGSGTKGGTHVVFSTSLKDLIVDSEGRLPLSDVSQGKEEDCIIWRMFPHVPYLHSSIVCLNDSVVVLGKDRAAFAPIFAFNSHLQKWVFVRELPFPCHNSAVVSIPSGGFVVFGGVTQETSTSNIVHLVTLQKPRLKNMAPEFDNVHASYSGHDTMFYDLK